MSKNSFGAFGQQNGWSFQGKRVSPMTMTTIEGSDGAASSSRAWKYAHQEIRPADILAPMKELEKTGPDSHMQYRLASCAARSCSLQSLVGVLKLTPSCHFAFFLRTHEGNASLHNSGTKA